MNTPITDYYTSATLEEIFRTLHIPQGDMGAFENYVNKSYEDSKELEAIRAVFDHGADDELWFPGTTVSESVKILKEKYLKYKEMFDMQTKIVVDLEMRLLKMEGQISKDPMWQKPLSVVSKPTTSNS